MSKAGTEAANAELEKVNEEENAELRNLDKGGRERECELNNINNNTIDKVKEVSF